MKKIIKITLIIFTQSTFCIKDNKLNKSKKSLIRDSIIEIGKAAVLGGISAIGLNRLSKKSNLASKVKIQPLNTILQNLEQSSIKKHFIFGASLAAGLYGAYKIDDYFKTKKLEEREKEEREKEEREKKEREKEEREKEEREKENLFLIMPSIIYHSFFAKKIKENNYVSNFICYLLSSLNILKKFNFHCLNNYDEKIIIFI